MLVKKKKKGGDYFVFVEGRRFFDFCFVFRVRSICQGPVHALELRCLETISSNIGCLYC